MDMYGLGSASWSGDIKEDAMDIAKLGGSALVGAAIAKAVVDFGGKLVQPTSAEAAAAGDASKGDDKKAKESAVRNYVVPLAPVLVGLAIHNRLKGQYPVAAPGVAAGMVAVGLGRLISNFVAKPKADAQGKVGMDIAAYLPGGRDSALNGLGFTYDSPLMGLGYSYGAGVDAYMNGAPTQVQALMGMPVQVQTLSGLGSTIVGNGAPMSAALM